MTQVNSLFCNLPLLGNFFEHECPKNETQSTFPSFSISSGIRETNYFNFLRILSSSLPVLVSVAFTLGASTIFGRGLALFFSQASFQQNRWKLGLLILGGCNLLPEFDTSGKGGDGSLVDQAARDAGVSDMPPSPDVKLTQSDGPLDGPQPDFPPDLGSDLGRDLGVDAPLPEDGPEARLDARADAVQDAAVVAIDAPVDAPPDLGLDAGPDLGPDLGPDAAPDIGVPPISALVGWWRLDDGAGSETARDEVGDNRTPGTLSETGVDWTEEGVLDGAVIFSGGSIVMEGTNTGVSPFDFGGGNFTLSTWIQSLENDRTQTIIDKRNSSGTDGFKLGKDNVSNRLELGFGESYASGSPCASIIADEGGDLSDGNWHYVMAVREGAEVRLYTDGNLAQVAVCEDNASSTGTLTIGCNTPEVTCQQPFTGSIDDVVISGRAISSVEACDQYLALCADNDVGVECDTSCNLD